jgi:hypothetical protein
MHTSLLRALCSRHWVMRCMGRMRLLHAGGLQVALPSTLVFDYPSVDAIASYVATLAPLEAAATAIGTGGSEDESDNEEEGYSDSDLGERPFAATTAVNGGYRVPRSLRAKPAGWSAGGQRLYGVAAMAHCHAGTGSAPGSVAALADSLQDTIRVIPEAR